MLRVNKQKCVGCQACLQNCPGATKIGVDGKAEIIDQKKLEKCGGESICPTGAIEKVSNRGRGPGLGRGMGAGSGRGLGRGPRDGRGEGRGGGGRRR